MKAPILDAVDLKLAVKLTGAAHDDNSSVYSRPPSPEVDAAWDRISMEGMEAITISSTDIAKSGKDPRSCIIAPSSWARGSDAYMAQIDVFHQIHCLDIIRKHMHKEYYFNNTPDSRSIAHRDHCLDTILESVMCHADTGIITHNWVYVEDLGRARPREDFMIYKKCGDFEALLGWAQEQALPDFHAKWKDLEATPRAIISK
ncbi:hypothetical protein GQ53DRAFT_852044 [Thozetella sp. PMI_491]|nr:hypothetical protein GQ53DRAFT_852044 [Thozetella sp. PMI_491]